MRYSLPRTWTFECLGLGLLLLCLGCRPEPVAEIPERTVRIATYGDPLSLDPHLANEHGTSSILSNVYDSLLRFDASLTLQPSLALDWDTPSPTIWRFRLRPGVTFHDGSSLDADDVVFSLERARDHPESQVTGYLVAVKEVHAVDSLTVEIETFQPFATLLNKLAFVAIVPEESPERIENPIGSGPYQLTEIVPGEKITLQFLQSYWGEPPAVTKAEMLMIADRGQRLAMLEKGEVDLIGGLREEDALSIAQTDGLRVLSGDSLVVEFLEMSIDKAPLNDLRVRQAMGFAIDRDALVDEIYSGQGRPMAQLFTQHVVGHIPDYLPPRRNLAKARLLLAEAGYPNGIDLDMDIDELAYEQTLPLVEQLAEADIRVHLIPRDSNELYENLFAGKVALHLTGAYAESGDASDILDEIVHSRDSERGYGVGNAMAYSNPKVDALIEQSGVTLKPLERRRLLQECHALVLEDMALIPLFVRKELYGVNDQIEWQPRLDALVLVAELRPVQKN